MGYVPLWPAEERNSFGGKIEYLKLSHALKNTANQRPGLPLHILRYVTGNMQRVVFHSSFPSLLARNSLLGSI